MTHPTIVSFPGTSANSMFVLPPSRGGFGSLKEPGVELVRVSALYLVLDSAYCYYSDLHGMVFESDYFRKIVALS